MVAVTEGINSFVSFHYERLLDLRYVCRRMNQLENECGVTIKCKKDERAIQRDYDPWLRAETTRVKALKSPRDFQSSLFGGNEVTLCKEQKTPSGKKVHHKRWR
ncbi:hypothetical protein REPUB_Repub13aG0054700 [Reevesia pubescens]